LLEHVGADEEIENTLLIFFCNLGSSGGRLHALVDPAAAFGSVNVINLDADCGGINGARFAGVFAFELQFRSDARAQKTERIEIGLDVSPLPEGAKNAFPLRIEAVLTGSVDYSGIAGSLRFRGSHRFVTRITDAGHRAGDSGDQGTLTTEGTGVHGVNQ